MVVWLSEESTTGICSGTTAVFGSGKHILLWLGNLSVGQVFQTLLLYVWISCVVNFLISPGETF